MSCTTQLTLVNDIPKDLAATVEFRHRQAAGGNYLSSTIPAGGQAQIVSADDAPEHWEVYALVNGTATEVQRVLGPNATVVCSLKEGWSARLSSDAEAHTPKALERSGNAHLQQWLGGDAGAFPRLLQVVGKLNTAVLGDHREQERVRGHLVRQALARRDDLDTETCAELLAHLPLPDRDDKARRDEDAALWLDIKRRLRDAIDPAFDPGDRPLLKVAPPAATGLPPGVAPEAIADPELRAQYQAGLDANRAKADRYRRQIVLGRWLNRLEAQLDRAFALLYTAPEASGPAAEPAGEAAIRFIPEHDFAGRSYEHFGVGETLRLTPGPQLPPSPDLHWRCLEGGGTLSFNHHGEALFRVGPAAETARLALVDGRSGKTLAEAAVTSQAPTPPTGASMAQQSGTALKHEVNTWSVGFLGEIFLTPANVSYAGVYFREGTVNASATGWLALWNGLTHSIGVTHTIGVGDPTHANKVNAVDNVFSGRLTSPYGVGSFLWAIPWQYSLDGIYWVTFYTANHLATSDSNGKAEISKAGSGTFSRVPADPTSDFGPTS